MTDRELLEAAAKAAGIKGQWADNEHPGGCGIYDGIIFWNPLENDGDALRLAVKLQMTVSFGGNGHSICVHPTMERTGFIDEPISDGAKAARRAIVRAAAIGG